MHGHLRTTYFWYLALLVWVPIPFGSNRLWGESLLETWIFVLMFSLCIYKIRHDSFLPHQYTRVAPILIMLLLWLGYLGWRTGIQIFNSWWAPSYAEKRDGVLFLLGQGRELVTQGAETIGMPAVVTNWWNELNSGIPNQLDKLSNYIDYGAGLQELILVVAYVGVFFLTIVLCAERKRIQTLFLVISMVGITEACIGIINGIVFFLQNGAGDFRSIAHGTFVNRNHYSAFLNITAFCIIGLLLDVGIRERRERSRWMAGSYLVTRIMDWRVQFMGGLGLVIVAQFLTQSRGGLIALISSFTVGLILVGLRKTVFARYAEVFRGSVILFLVLLILFGAQIVLSRFAGDSWQLDSRDRVWTVAVQAAKDYWLFGTGLRSTGMVYPLYDNGEVSRFVDHVHNDYLETWLEQGLLGIFLLGVAVLWSVRNAIKTLLRSSNREDMAYTLAGLMAVLSMMVHGLFDFNFRIPANALYFFVMLAVISQPGWSWYKTKGAVTQTSKYQPGALTEFTPSTEQLR